MVSKEEHIRLIFGLKIRQLRSDKHYSLAELATKTGISISYLNEIEKGKKYPKANKIMVLAKALEVSYDWLVSLQMSKKLAPIAELIKSDLLTSLPLDIFGIEPDDLIDIISNTPAKVSAFISTLIEIARTYDLTVENFYFSVLRSFQEMHENYFEDLENEVEKFRELHHIDSTHKPELKDLQDLLVNPYQYLIDETTLEGYQDLKNLRSVTIPGKSKRILINKKLSDTQKKFTFARELGYAFMQLKNRTYTSTWIKIESFEQILNNFKASYFAGALLIPKDRLIDDLKILFAEKKWNEELFLKIMGNYDASPEMFLHRITNIAPKFFGLSQLFFLRFHHQNQSDEFHLNKELHLAGLYNPHGTMLNQHYCRRWISLNILKDLDKQQKENNSDSGVLCGIQRSQYFDSDNEYLCISLAKAINPTPDTNSSITVGFLMNKEFKQKVKFWDDPQILTRKVGVACERCSAVDCKERAAPAKNFNEKQKTDQMQTALEKLNLEMKNQH